MRHRWWLVPGACREAMAAFSAGLFEPEDQELSDYGDWSQLLLTKSGEKKAEEAGLCSKVHH